MLQYSFQIKLEPLHLAETKREHRTLYGNNFYSSRSTFNSNRLITDSLKTRW